MSIVETACATTAIWVSTAAWAIAANCTPVCAVLIADWASDTFTDASDIAVAIGSFVVAIETAVCVSTVGLLANTTFIMAVD